MQTFSNMRRNSSHSQIIATALLFIAFFIYESLASRFALLPPLLGVLFYFFRRYDEQDDFWHFCLILVAVCIVAIFNDIALWFLPLLFGVLVFVFNFIFENLAESKVLRVMQVAGVYGVFFATLHILNGSLGFDMQITPLTLVYCCVIESVMVGIYEYTI